MKYYDPSRKQLVYIREEPTPDYWDRHWNAANIRRRVLRPRKYSYVVRITKKYLKPSDGPILEGGCGLGFHVESLGMNGYKCIGIDNAVKTVRALQRNIPELDIRLGDVRKLSFPDNYFAGYWSIGVIEHFWDGYNDIAEEMSRVIEPDGYLFLSFPYMSWYRKVSAKLGSYKEFNNQNVDSFYQFALNAEDVITNFEKMGFRLIKRKPRGILYGIRDEITPLSPIVDCITKRSNENTFTKAFYSGLESIMSAAFGFIFGHVVLLVFRRIS